MKKLLVLAVMTIALAGCLGNSSSDNTLIAQVKKAKHVTPLLLPDYDSVDLSLGVMRNGVGSMSHEDMLMYVSDKALFKTMQDAADSGALVKVTYDTARFRFYVPHPMVTNVTIVK